MFAHEIGTWSVSGAKSHEPFVKPVDATVRDLAGRVNPDYLDEISLFHNAGGELVVFFHTHAMNGGKPDDLGVIFELHPDTHEVLVRREGYGSELFGTGAQGDKNGALDEFLVDLHVNLTAPEPIGLYLTGILGLMMLVAAVSGLLIHRHVIRDLFLSPRESKRESNQVLKERDRHALAGSWGLPFAFILAFILAFTGSFMSFATALGLPAVAAVAFGGDQMAMMETLFGGHGAEDRTPTRLANLDAMRDHSNSRYAAPADSIVITHYGRADTEVSIVHPPGSGRLNGIQPAYHGATGEFKGIKPNLGTQPSAGDTVLGVMGPLHFGHFAGLLSKAVWFSLGMAMCYVSLTGMLLWLRRRKEDRTWQRLARAVPAVGYGLPIALAAAGVGFFLSLPGGDTFFWTYSGFWIAVALVSGYGLWETNGQRLSRYLQLALAVALLGLPIIRMLASGADWAESMTTGNAGVVSMDVLLLLLGGVFARAGLTSGSQRAAERTPPPSAGS